MNYVRTRTVRAAVYVGCALALLVALAFTPSCESPLTVPPDAQTATHAYWAPETEDSSSGLVWVDGTLTYPAGGGVK